MTKLKDYTIKEIRLALAGRYLDIEDYIKKVENSIRSFRDMQCEDVSDIIQDEEKQLAEAMKELKSVDDAMHEFHEYVLELQNSEKG